jgi:hypothetical protein
MPGYFLKIGHGHFLPHPFQFSTQSIKIRNTEIVAKWATRNSTDMATPRNITTIYSQTDSLCLQQNVMTVKQVKFALYRPPRA